MFSETIPSAIVIIPPLLVLASAIITRRVIASLAIGVLIASAIFCAWSPVAMFSHIGNSLYHVFLAPGSDKLYLFAFLAAIGTLIELMTHSGGIAAYTKFLHRFITTKKAAQATALTLSNSFFLDDYLNSLVTGSIMRPLTDSFKIPRIKLAFLLNSMSASLCVLIPATTWVALVLNIFQEAGVTDVAGANQVIASDQFMTYLMLIPFLFYPLFIIFSAWFVVLKPISFGLMREQEQIAQKTGNLFGGAAAPHTEHLTNISGGSMAHFVVPMGTFLGMLIFFLLYTGKSVLFGGTNSLFEALKSAKIIPSLFYASLCSLGTLAGLLAYERRFSFKKVGISAIRGILLMKNSMIVLTLALTFAWILQADLNTGGYIAHIITASLPIWVLPILVFALATITTASTGSSWGTITILMPLTLTTLASLATGTPPFALFAIPTFLPTIGAILAGSVAGAHISPITDATVVSAMSARANHLEHVSSQLSYSLPALIGASVAFLISGLTYTWHPGLTLVCALGAGLAITAAGLLWRNQEA